MLVVQRAQISGRRSRSHRPRSAPAAASPHAPRTERPLTILVAVADRRPVRVPLPLRTDELVGLML